MQPTVYAVANLRHFVMVARQQGTNLLEPAAGEFPALLASDLYSMVTYLKQQQTINMKCNFH